MKTLLFMDDLLFKYGFPNHPLTPLRYKYFQEYLSESGLLDNPDLVIASSSIADESLIALFHTKPYIERVKELSEIGYGLLDRGDTPAYKGVYEVAASSVYATVEAVKRVVEGEYRFALNLAGGWHHAMRNSAGGFCVFNDIGVAIEYLKKWKSPEYPILYIDIDAHHGDGVYYPFESDPYVYIFDIHEDGRYLYPGTGFAHEEGSGPAKGTKKNIPLPPYAGDEELLKYIDMACSFARDIDPSIILLQGGLDGLAGDPLTHLNYTVDGYINSVRRILETCIDLGIGLVFLGGGGYQPRVVARTWIDVIKLMLSL